MKQKIVIGITDCGKYPNYEKWILTEPDVEVIRLGHSQDNFDEIEKCDGIVLTGGEDVNPNRYNRPEYISYCDQEDMDEKRDEFEWKVLEYTQQNNVPVLAICRGLQITNVFFGGSLIPDLPSFGGKDHAKIEDKDRYHDIKVIANSLLSIITGTLNGEVNSAHHQSADRIGDGLMVNAVSEEGVVEGLERQSPEGKPFLLMVQWHPERMTNRESTFTKNIKSAFIDQARKGK